ncbi:MAG: biotin transporter BioY [Desulfobacteraceae bacterium]|nr:biotin transporter BioY [Desulfobacteraceae bacterium]
MTTDGSLRKLVFASLMAALIAVGAYIAIPMWPVPIVMQNLFVLLAGLLLGSRWAAASVGVYLLAGACGLPVFAHGGGGLGHLIGPTGGYLFGFVPCAYIVGFVSERSNQRMMPEVLAMIAASLFVYAAGVPWLKMIYGMSLGKALVAGMYPFLIGDALKIAAAAYIARRIRPLVNEFGLKRSKIVS